jgi:hypothetical protein
MSDVAISGVGRSRRIGRSIIALVVGFLAGIFLTLVTDIGLSAIGVLPRLGQPATSGPLVLATAYRTIYGVASSYVIARLAPGRPMEHALLGGAIGLVLNVVGAIVTWNRGLGPHWYPLALVVLAMPPAWVGGKLRVMQLPANAAD